MSMSRMLPSAPRSGSLRAPGLVHMSGQVIELMVSGDQLEVKQITLKIMDTPLEGPLSVLARLKTATAHGLAAMHDYILVEYAPGKCIMAEKGGESRGAKAGIHLSLVESGELEQGRLGSVRYETTISLGTGPVKLTVAKLRQIMASLNPNYDVFSDNCQAYAFDSAKAILEWHLENTVDENVRAELGSELEKLKHVERLQLKAAVGALLGRKHLKSVQAAKLFDRN